MSDPWRIRHKRYYNDFGNPQWYYVLERKRKFLFWDYWKRIDSEHYHSYLSGRELENAQNNAIAKLEKRRLKILGDEAASESVVKEWV
jgi:hypothetical protein